MVVPGPSRRGMRISPRWGKQEPRKEVRSFSSSGELFVSLHFSGGIVRFRFDDAGNAVPNGTIATDTLGGIAIFDFTDRDEDGIFDVSDNCPDIPNESQSDRDLDGLGDPCDCAPNDSEEPGEDGACPGCGITADLLEGRHRAPPFLFGFLLLGIGFSRLSTRPRWGR